MNAYIFISQAVQNQYTTFKTVDITLTKKKTIDITNDDMQFDTFLKKNVSCNNQSQIKIPLGGMDYILVKSTE